jgi:hypothetical protein
VWRDETSQTKKGRERLSERDKQKADFIGACTKDFTAPTCELMWNDAVAKVNGDASQVIYKPLPKDKGYDQIALELEQTKLKLDRTNAQLSQSNELLKRVNDVTKAEKEAQKERLIIDIINNSKYTKDMLAPKSYDDLKLIADALENTEKGFVSVAADVDQTKRRKGQLTVGQWDSEKKDWIGGN